MTALFLITSFCAIFIWLVAFAFFFRDDFEVKNKTDANNLAYTTGHLPFHVDLPFLNSPPDVSVPTYGVQLNFDASYIFTKWISEGNDPLFMSSSHGAHIKPVKTTCNRFPLSGISYHVLHMFSRKST